MDSARIFAAFTRLLACFSSIVIISASLARTQDSQSPVKAKSNYNDDYRNLSSVLLFIFEYTATYPSPRTDNYLWGLKLLEMRIRIEENARGYLNLSISHFKYKRIPSRINLFFQIKMQNDFLFEPLFLSIFIENQIANAAMAQAVTISRYIE